MKKKRLVLGWKGQVDFYGFDDTVVNVTRIEGHCGIFNHVRVRLMEMAPMYGVCKISKLFQPSFLGGGQWRLKL